MNIIIPIGGTDKRTADTEYIKTLQEIERKTILQYAFESVQELNADNFIVVVKRRDANQYHLDNIVKLLRADAQVVIAENETMGAACTCMLTIDKLKLNDPLVIAGSDQILLESPRKIVDDFQNKNYDGGVAIFDDIHPRWSYVRLDENDHVIEAAEKRPISRNAVAGFYYFKTAEMFIEAAKSMIMKNAGINGQFFVCPVFNEMVLAQKTIGVYRIDKSQYYNVGHSSGMEAFRAYLNSKKQGDMT